MLQSIRDRMRGPGGYAEVMRVALPLILSNSAYTVQLYTDRMFLSWFSTDALAAAVPASLVAFTVTSLFLGLAGYTNAFVAQYDGAGRPERIGPSIWQGLYVAVLAGVVGISFNPLAASIFAAAGHAPGVQAAETEYFRVSCYGIGFNVAGMAASSFYSGRGKTMPILWVNVLATSVNVALDYALIFGKWGFPAWGVAGAAAATVFAQFLGFVIFMALMLGPYGRACCGTLSGWRFDRTLFMRLLRFGLPSGIQFFQDIFCFTLFLLLLGKIGQLELAASNLAFNINMLAFVPMIGMAIAITTIVGQGLGANRPDIAQRGVWSAFQIAIAYMGFFCVLYVLVPEWLFSPYAARMDQRDAPAISAMAVTLLRFVAAYSLFDTCVIVFSSALKGAGDTRYVMIASALLAWFLMVVPTWWFCVMQGRSLYWGWTWLTIYVAVLGLTYLARFLGGRWRDLRIIEPHLIATPPPAPARAPGEI